MRINAPQAFAAWSAKSATASRLLALAARRTLPVFAALCLSTAPALASDPADAPAPDGACRDSEVGQLRGFTVRLENDLFANRDRDYTNGVSLTAVSRDMRGPMRPECLPWPIRLHAELIKRLDPGFWRDSTDATPTRNAVLKFGQSMYTPQDPKRTDLVADDRPYAGLLYVGMSWNRRQFDEQNNSEMLDTREITLGVIGPWSLARQAQDLFHGITGVEKFQGWQHQLKNEPALQLALDRKYRAYRGGDVVNPGFSADAIRSFGLRLGNIETSATFGLEGRVGWSLPNDFGTYPIRPGAENRPPSAPSIGARSDSRDAMRGRRPGAHLFVVLEAKAVAHDFSLDGNLFRTSHSVTRRPLVGQAALGVSVHGPVAGHGVRLAMMRVFRSREFDEQSSNHAFGSIALSIEF